MYLATGVLEPAVCLLSLSAGSVHHGAAQPQPASLKAAGLAGSWEMHEEPCSRQAAACRRPQQLRGGARGLPCWHAPLPQDKLSKRQERRRAATLAPRTCVEQSLCEGEQQRERQAGC
jgi:hypothetical protein